MASSGALLNVSTSGLLSDHPSQELNYNAHLGEWCPYSNLKHADNTNVYNGVNAL